MVCPVNGTTSCKCGTKGALRVYFTEHAVYTKLVINSLLDGSKDLNVLVARLLKNQEDLGNAVGAQTSPTVGAQLTVLLKDHINNAANVLTNLKSGSDQLTGSIKALFANSEQVARFISSLAPNRYDEIKHHFDQHNQYVIDIATAHYRGEYQKEVAIYDEYYHHMLSFSDLVSELVKKNTTNYICIAIVLLLLFLIWWQHRRV